MAIGISRAFTEMITEKAATRALKNNKIKIALIKKQRSEVKPSSMVRYRVRERAIKIKITFSVSV